MHNAILPHYLHSTPLLSAGTEWANLEWECEVEGPETFLWASHQASLPKAYFFSSHQQTRLMGIGAFKTLSHLEMNQTWEQIKAHPNSFLMGGQTFFESAELPEAMWNDVRPHFYFLPRIYFCQPLKGKLKIGLNLSHLESLDYQERKILPFDFLQFFASMPKSEETPTQCLFLSHKSTPDKNTWKKLIENFSGEKVVFARRLSIHCDQSARPFLQEKWQENEKMNTNVFWLELSPQWFFLSFSPERLFSWQKNILAIDVLAGTTPRGSTQEIDHVLADKLLTSAKNHHEHRFVLDAIRANLSELGLKPELIFSGQLLKLTHVQHIHSLWQTETPEHLSPFTIIQALHPTPAVGGHPRKNALEQIAAGEGYERGLYAAPVGVLSADYSEILVAIRSALSEGNKLHVFAGAGIVDQSDPELEWQETAHKMKNFVPLDLTLPHGVTP